MNQFEEAEQLSDLEFLKSFKPEWMNDRLEPLTPPPYDITPPTWNKVELDFVPDGTTTTGTEVQPGTTKVICAVQSGFTYIPKLMTPVEGTTFEDP